MFLVFILFIVYPLSVYFISHNLVVLFVSYLLSLILYILFLKIKKSKSIILDTSVLQDARISDLINSNLFDKFILPRFVIKEIEKEINTSKDKILENTLSSIKKNKKVSIVYTAYFNIKSSEFKVIKLAKKLNATIITNNFNLTKNSLMRNIKIVDINDLYERLKPIILPGYTIPIMLVKEGKERKQAIGFLNDGTTVIVEQARNYIGKKVNVKITSSLHTSTNKMLFAKLQEEDNIKKDI